MIVTLAYIKQELRIEDNTLNAQLLGFIAIAEGYILTAYRGTEQNLIDELYAKSTSVLPNSDVATLSTWVDTHAPTAPFAERQRLDEWRRMVSLFQNAIVMIVNWLCLERGIPGFGEGVMGIASVNKNQGGVSVTTTYKNVYAEAEQLIKPFVRWAF